MFFFKKSPMSNNPLLERKLKYLRIVFWACYLVIFSYFFRYNFEFKTNSFNIVFIITLTLLSLAPFFYEKTKKIVIASYLVLIPASSCLLLLLWTSGGINAPGIFWLSAIPLSTAILLGIRPAVISVSIVTLFLIASVVMEANGINTNIMIDKINPSQERSINIFFFLFYSFITSIYFIRSESNFQEQIHDQKNEINRLLRLLVHDIANPLTAILYTAEILKKGKASDPEKSFQNILRSSNNIKALLERVKSFTALKDGKTKLEKKPILLQQIIDELQHDLKITFEKKQINFICKLNHTQPYILGDSTVLSQVILTNILTNAVKFSCPNDTIELATHQDGNTIAIEIRDYGIGIPPQIVKNLFSPSEQTHRKGTSGESGTGFGMPLVKDFTEKLDGKIDVVTSEVDTPTFKRGTCFKLKLPSTHESKSNPGKKLLSA